MSRVAAGLAVALLLITACAAGGQSIAGSSRTVRGVTVTFRIDPAIVEAGQTVRLAVTLFNAAGVEEKLTFPSGQKYDFVVTKDGTPVWKWSQDRFFVQAITTEMIPTQGSVQYGESFIPEDAGDYDIEAVVLAERFDKPLKGRLEVTR